MTRKKWRWQLRASLHNEKNNAFKGGFVIPSSLWELAVETKEMECTSRRNVKTPSTSKCNLAAGWQRKVIITSPHPPMLRLKSQVFEGWNSRIKIALCRPNSLLLCDTIKIYFPPWPHPFSRQDEQSYSVRFGGFFWTFLSQCVALVLFIACSLNSLLNTGLFISLWVFI